MIRTLAAMLAALLLPAAAALAQPAFTPAQRAEIVAIIRDALRQDPTILRDALAAMEAAEAEQRQGAQRAAIVAEQEALFRSPEDAIKGNPRGDITIVEFFDARCGYCKQLHPTIEALIRRDGNLRVVLKDLPILGPASVLASRALVAAQRQGRYVELYDALARLRGEVTEATLRQEAERVGLDWARLRREMEDPAVQRRLEGNLRLARRLGIDGTPALVIGTRLIPGAVDLATLEDAIAEARAAR